MLLRRISKHVKEQNWFAVALDFVIVVVGILLAFQITEWSDRRNERAQEQIWLTRLHGDFGRILEQGNYLTPRMSAQVPALQRVIGHIRSGTPPELEGEFFEDLKKINQVWVHMELSPTYSELVATGELSKIRNEMLRKKLAEYRRSNESDEILLQGQLSVRNNATVDRAVQYSIQDTEYLTTYIPTDYDWEALVAAQADLQVIYRNQILRTNWQEQSLDLANEIYDLLEQELH